MSLSDKEREQIASCVWGAGSRTRSPLLPSLLGKTERIIARHVAAALEQAADAIDADSDEFDAEARWPEPDAYSRGHRDGVVDGMETALELIKTQLRDYRAQIHN